MPTDLHRYYGSKDLHFITCSCYQRKPLLDTAERRDRFLEVLEQTREQYRFAITGYVVMPEHFHLLLSEPECGDLSTVMQVLKQRSSKSFCDKTERQLWQPRFYDFNVWMEEKRIERLRYIHRNPVARGLADKPDEWVWSSFRAYAYRERGVVQVEG